MATYYWLSIMRIFLSIGFGGVLFVFPGMAGELLRAEELRDAKYSSLLYYVKSTFFSRNVSWSIFFGYLLFFILLGFQAVLFYFGQEYLGVWKELTSLSQFSSSYLPFFGAFVIGVNASLDEEVIFRLFGISLSKRFLKSTTLAVILSSLVWGFGHTSYAIFPVWFRGIEVSFLGLVFGFAFIKFGFITVVVAHYLFDVFWGTATYLFGHSSAYLFFGSVAILSIPLVFAAVAFFANKEDKEKEIRISLDRIQKYNLGVLVVFVSAQKNNGFDAETIKKGLLSHNWDIELVDLAIEEVFKS
jgi:membrane protease YdiL (CAAX protease family)